jgi:starch synthase
MDGPLRHCASQGRLRGILNGIDTDVWSPDSDRNIPARFSLDDLSGKAACKRAVQERFKLPLRDDVPLFTTISRLAHQKGLDIFAEGLEDLLIKDDFQFVLVGSGDPFLQGRFNALAAKYPDKLAVYIGYAGEKLAHLVEAGGDFFIMPSRYEPCGLNQLYSMRYGNIPIVRSTGGLADTVVNYDPYDRLDEATGFSFWDLYPESLNNTIRWAANIYKNSPEDYKRLQRNGMSRDFSWSRTATEYERMYEDAHK